METQAIKYKILFAGQTLENVTYETARSNLSKLLKASEETIDRLFSGKPVVIKKDLDREQVDKYVSTLNQAGLEVKTDPPLAEEISLDPEEFEPVSGEPDTVAAPAKPAAATDNPYSSPAAADLLPQVHCRQCGAKIGQTEASCPQCGAKQEIGKPRSKVTAALLAIFLGWLGVHRFYLGQWWGVIYFVFGLLAWPIAILEGIVFLVTPVDKWDAKYGNAKPLGNAVAIVIGLILIIAVIGILAAIAIPQYADYTARAKVAQAMPKVEETKQQLEQFILAQNTLPNSNRQAGLPEQITDENLLSIEVQPGGVMQVKFGSTNTNLNEKTIVWVPELGNGRVEWDCSGGDLPKRYRPPQCREGKFKASQAPGNIQRFVADNGTVEVMVPTSWSRQELHPEAIVQAGNLRAEAYLLVHYEPKSDLPDFDINRYADVIVGSIAENSVDPVIQYIGNSVTNGMPGHHYRMDTKVDGYDLTYLMAIVEGKKDFYQVITWSLASRYNGNVDDFKYAINSFKER
jgi:Tfp pilus assembly major pilin PilA